MNEGISLACYSKPNVKSIIPYNSTDLVIEVIEIFLNTILYSRGIYPKQIFEKRRVYNAPIYVSIYPPLNNYILNVLKSAKELKENKKLHHFEIIIYKDEYTTYESYVFVIDEDSLIFSTEYSEDRYLIDMEEHIRKSLLTFSERVKLLGDLPKDAKFKVNLHTSQSAFVKFCNDPKFQDFFWVQETEIGVPDKKKVAILPMIGIESVGVQMYAETFR